MNSFLEIIAYFSNDSDLLFMLFAIAALAVIGVAVRVASHSMDTDRTKKSKDDEVREMIIKMGIEKRRQDAETAAKVQKLLE